MSAVPSGPGSAQRAQTLDNGWEVYSYLNDSGQRRWYVKTGTDEISEIATGPGVTQYLQPDGSTNREKHIFASKSEIESAVLAAQGGESGGSGSSYNPSSWEKPSDVPAYELRNNGIDFGRDGSLTPWSETPWSGGTDFNESMRVRIQTTEVGGRELDVYAKPDPQNRGDGAIYEVVSASSGVAPKEFRKTMTTQEQVQSTMEEFAERVQSELEQETSDTAGGDGGGSDKPATRRLQTLENGWEVWLNNGETYYVSNANVSPPTRLHPDGSMKPAPAFHEFETREALQAALDKALQKQTEQQTGRENTEEMVRTVEREDGRSWQVWSYLNKDGGRRWYVRVPEPSDAVPMSMSSSGASESTPSPPSEVDSPPEGDAPDASTTTGSFLQPNGTTASEYHEFTSKKDLETALGQSTDSAVGGLGYSWQLVETPQGKYQVFRRVEAGERYLEADGSTTSVEKSFASKKTARKAFRRWRDENVGQKRAEANETREEQSEEFQEALEQQQSSTQVETTTNTVEGDNVTATSGETGEGESGSGDGGGSGPTVEVSTSDEPTDTETTTTAVSQADDGGTIPPAAIAAVFVAMLIVVLR